MKKTIKLGDRTYSKKEYLIVKHIMNQLRKLLWEQHPKLKMIDSNLYHFALADIMHKRKELNFLTRGWFMHGIYFPIIDDILVYEEGQDKETVHQIEGNEKISEKMITCECHKGKMHQGEQTRTK